ncbi:DNA cytosine methyltransferase [Cyanobacterium stanieri LEGE 03274]|uniref:Cytosine-specific methyltransferase n=1 Tax=Cyanobacterium stanieri LEGE 03274 TaxID=1828756 RepID=A0ABR9V246_9CHRO|nr:DNA cytosine methyltransferase [Cyanobacterium stanieri]MBE9221634.1 DNA cytosine methyltransferase [Cyanobacterium stanieri LEGE 03274]
MTLDSQLSIINSPLRKRPIAIDLFAGCGGMSLGLEASGFDIVAAVEIDPIHALIHHLNFPYTKTICQDITQLDTGILKDILRKRELDLVAGGPPCQGFSLMGKRQLDDPRNSLVFEYLRVIRDLQPKYFIFENVPGMLTGTHQQFLKQLIEEFNNIGYTVPQPKIMDASDFGAPQKRKRLILLGSRGDMIPLNYPMETGEFNDVQSAIGDLNLIPAFIGTNQGIKAETLDYSGFRNNFALKPQGIYSLCHRRERNNLIYNHVGSNHTEKSKQRFQSLSPGKKDQISRFLKLSPNGLCNTLRAGTSSDKGSYTAPRPIHYQQARCITVREGARLHTFPDWFLFHETIWHGFREIGNAVIPIFAKTLGDEITKNLAVDVSPLETRKIKTLSIDLITYNMSQAIEYWFRSENF